MAVVPASVVTVMSTAPAVLAAGAMATIELLEVTRKSWAATDPNLTLLTLLKFDPLMVTTVPPADPPAGAPPRVTSRPAIVGGLPGGLKVNRSAAPRADVPAEF